MSGESGKRNENGGWTAVAALSLNRVIGKDGKIPWYLPEDFRWFKRLTMGGVLVMGRRTWEEIGKPLPGRKTLVLSSRQEGIKGESEDVQVIQSLDEVEKYAEGKKVFICGGGKVYAEALPRCEDLYLSWVQRKVDGDVFFPPFETLFEEKKIVLENKDFQVIRYFRTVVHPKKDGG